MTSLLAAFTGCGGEVPDTTHEAIVTVAPIPPAEAPEPEATDDGFYRLARPGDEELWVADDGRTVTFWRKARTLVRSESPDAIVKVSRKWNNWNALRLCLGQPLKDPPAEDPGGYRKLTWTDQPTWVLEYSGLNRCSATGEVSLQANGPKVDVSKLIIDGIPWERGGMERAKELGMGYVQLNAVEWWQSGNDADRKTLLRALRDDPDPASYTALQRILEIAGPGERRLVQSAIEYRPRQGPVTPDGTKPL